MIVEKHAVVNKTITKTLITAKIFDGFWDRWKAHGIKSHAISEVRQQLNSLDDWINGFEKFATMYESLAEKEENQGNIQAAEILFRQSGIYYNLIQWIFPTPCEEKRTWYNKSLASFKKADKLSNIFTTYHHLTLLEKKCAGRVRLPRNRTNGLVIIVNPLDSSKEELFTYELDFLEAGFVTVSFDGPGQGETYITNGLRATRDSWIQFINKVIDFTKWLHPDLSIHLFGTSSGAAWSIYGSNHPNVQKAVAVSPAIESKKEMPDYFLERMHNVLDGTDSMLPELFELQLSRPILLFHGNQDAMVSDQSMYRLYEALPEGKALIEYEDEGHCCNGKLREVRELSARWFLEGEEKL